MTKTTQMEWIEQQLKTHGSVSRNEALRNYISRLGARINDLKKKGINLEGEYVETSYGRDFVYRLPKETLF